MDLNGKRVAILVAEKFHEKEAIAPRDFLQSKNAKVDMVGLTDEIITGKYGRLELTPDKTINELKAEDYDAVIIPGGGAPERIRLNRDALDFIRAFWQTGRPVAAICHGPQVLISANLLQGVKLTCYAGIRDDVILAGAEYLDAPVTIDGQLITSRTPDDLADFNNAIFRAMTTGFLDDEEADMDVLSALELAISRERGAQDFYLQVASTVVKVNIQNKFKYLATVESEHFDQLSDLYVKLSQGKHPRVDPSITEVGKKTVDASISGEEALELAMQSEQKAYDFYRNAALKSSSTQAKEMFEYLASEELEHKRLLSIDSASDRAGKGHFQWATYWDVPPGMEHMW
jgi:protease I